MAATALEPIAVREAGGGLRADLRAVRVVWRRELLRFFRNRLRIATSLMQPVLFLFILGGGLARMLPSSGNVDYRTFMFPGVIAIPVPRAEQDFGLHKGGESRLCFRHRG